MFSTIRKNDKFKAPPVSWDNNIDVPEIPLSYSLTGVRKIVTPKAFIQPATSKIRKFYQLNFLRLFLNEFFTLSSCKCFYYTYILTQQNLKVNESKPPV